MNTKPVTKHFNKRARQRAGLNKKSIVNFYNKANICGLRLHDFKSRPLFFNYLMSITKPKYHIIVYNRYILICADEGDVGITILNLPREYYSTVDSIRKMKKEENNIPKKLKHKYKED